jgi:arylsulfatase A-like enzyme
MLKNVILITIDSLRRDSVGFINPNCKLTPNLDRLAKRSIVMENAFSAGGGTIYAMSSIMTSSFPIINLKDTTIKGWPTLAEEFKKRGYRTAAFHSNPWLSQPFGFDQGFDEFRYVVPAFPTEDVIDVGPLAKRIPEAINEFANMTIRDASLWIRGPDLMLSATNWIKRLDREQPYFVWIHPMDLHFPYTHPTMPMERLNPGRILRYGFDFLCRYSSNDFVKAIGRNFSLIEEYNASIRYLDEALGSFCDRFPDSLIVIMSDHGDFFGEHGRVQHPGNLYNEIIRIPMLIYDPDHSHQIVRSNFSAVEAGELIKSFSFENGTYEYVSLEPKVNVMFSIHVDYTAKFRRTSVVEGSSKLIVTENMNDKSLRVELYDIERDPRELKDQSQDNKDLVSNLMALRASIMKSAERQRVKMSMKQLVPMFQKKTMLNSPQKVELTLK